MRKTFTTAKDATISLTLNGKKKKTGMFTHKISGIYFKIKDSRYRVVLGLLFYKCGFFDGDFVSCLGFFFHFFPNSLTLITISLRFAHG